MQMTNKENDPFLTPFSDFFSLCKRKKNKILFAGGVVAILSALNGLMNPVEYLAEGTFRERSPKPSNVGGGGGVTSLFISNMLPNDNEAIATIQSRSLMKKVVEKLGLQATIDQTGYSDSYLNRIREHLITDYAIFNNHLSPSLPDFSVPFRINDIFYGGESPLVLKISHEPDNTYVVWDGDMQKVGEGSYGIPFKNPHFHFTLDRTGKVEPTSKPYNLILWPLSYIADGMSKNLKVETDTKDKNVLKLAYRNRDRHLACQVVNATMICYQDHLKASHDRQSSLQLAYLQQRQDETGLYLAELMHKHAQSLSEDLSSVGFADSEKEMAFLANNQHQLKEKLLSKELEMKRLQNLLSGNCVYYDRYTGEGDANIINSILEQIRSLNQQRDSLQLTLSKSSYLDPNQIQSTLNDQLRELKEAQLYSREINAAIEAYKSNSQPDITSHVYNDTHYLLKSWHNNLFNDIPKRDTSQWDDWKERKERFLFYLENLRRLFSVNEKIIQERLAHQHNTSLEFQGVNLKTADELYVGYSRQLNEIEGEIRRNRFLTAQVEDPTFEISSLSPSLKDPVSQGMITKASQLSLDLKDENNRTVREQERLKQELELQRNFLLLHLKQMTELMALNHTLIEEKIFSLQNITLELIHQQISLLEKNQSDYISSRLENLKEESKIIQQHIDDIHANMATLPQRWVSEKLIEQSVATSQLIVEEIAKMVEFKNINHKLELIQSSPIDVATPSLHSTSSRLILRTFIGFFMGCFGAMTWFAGSSLLRGMKAGTTNLQLRGQQVLGSLSKDYKHDVLSPLRDDDLSTLRRLQGIIAGQNPGVHQRLLLIEGRGPDYSSDVMALLAKKGIRVLTLSLSFNEKSSSNEPGLMQYLTGQASKPTILQSPEGDKIEAGGFTRFSTELLGTQKFKALLIDLQSRYDWIIGVSNALPASSEAEALLHLFPNVVVSLDQETLPELEKYYNFGAEEGHHVAFILLDEQ